MRSILEREYHDVYPQVQFPLSASTISRQKWRPCQKIHHRNHTEITLTAWFYQKQQMAELEQAVKKIDAKLRMLKFTTEEVPRIREKKELKGLERLQKDLKKQLDGVHEQKVQIQALKIEQGDDLNDVREWTLEIENSK